MPRLIKDQPKRLRERARKDGSVRLWWEPEAAIRPLGFATVELDAARPTWSVRKAKELNREVDRARRTQGLAAARKGRTVAALIEEYRRSPKWREGLKPASRRDYNGAFAIIERKWGTTLLADITKPAMAEWYEALYVEAGRWQAAALIRKFSLLFSYAERKGWVSVNPCLRLDIQIPAPRQRIATWDEIDHLVATADRLGLPEIGDAVILAICTGQRQKDILEAELAHVEGDRWLFVRSKRGNHGGVRLAPEAMARLRAAGLRAADARVQLIADATGAGYSGDRFRRHLAQVRDAAAETMPSLADLQFRDLRRTFGTMARAGGASERDVADALGNNSWKDPKLSGTYMVQTFETANRAVDAVKRQKQIPRKRA